MLTPARHNVSYILRFLLPNSLAIMPFSHHSHSGEFCGHATDTLEECIQQAIRKGLTVFALTEHMPRDMTEDLYPEEVGKTKEYPTMEKN